MKQAIFEQIYINNTSSTRAGASQINNWKLMIKARRTWVKQKNRQYLFCIRRKPNTKKIGKDRLFEFERPGQMIKLPHFNFF